METVPLRHGVAALPAADWQPGVADAGRCARRWLHWPILAVIVLIIAVHGADRWWRATTIASIPPAPSPASGLFIAPVPLSITVSAAGQRAPWLTTDQDVRDNVELWKRMHLEDWNAVPEPLRAAGLDNMLRRYTAVINTPAVWDHMTVFDWDEVPQPIRTVAYRRMVAYWAGFYAVGAAFALPPWLVADTLSAMVMSESWFDHRARSRNRDGTWDLGLAQASQFARQRIRQLHARGLVDVEFADEDLANPWRATRFIAVWMTLMLDEKDGDLERAVRAYNRGSADAMDSLGAKYWATVQQRLTRFIRNGDSPPAWDHLWRRAKTSPSG